MKRVAGSGLPAEIWQAVMQEIHDGLPVEPLGVLLAVDTIPDVFCTIGNTTGDMTATSIVARRMAPADDA